MALNLRPTKLLELLSRGPWFKGNHTPAAGHDRKPGGT
jgi:hypothetical protein